MKRSNKRRDANHTKERQNAHQRVRIIAGRDVRSDHHGAKDRAAEDVIAHPPSLTQLALSENTPDGRNQ